MNFGNYKFYPNVNYDLFNRQFSGVPKDDFDFLSKEEQDDVLHFRKTISDIYTRLIVREFTGSDSISNLSKKEKSAIRRFLDLFAIKDLECESIQLQTMFDKTLHFSFKYDDLDIEEDISIENVIGNFFFVDGGVPGFQPALIKDGVCYIFIPAERYTVVFRFLEEEYEKVKEVWSYFVAITKLDFNETHFANVPVNLSNTLKVYNLFKDKFKVYPVRLAFKFGDGANVDSIISLQTN